MEDTVIITREGFTTLIIDDEVEFCMMMQGFFKRTNRQVDFSISLKDGLNKFKESLPDVLILDHNLPDGHGIGNIQKFKEIKKGHNLYIIVISAMSNLKLLALENGADYFLTKPITFRNLIEIIQKRK